MASVFWHLRDTLPFVMGIQSLLKADGYPALHMLPAKMFMRHIWPVAPGAKISIPYPMLRLKKSVEARRLWAFRHDGNTPHKITHITCRNREAGYRNHVVCDEVEFGRRTSGTTIAPEIEIKTADNVTAKLPLTKTYLHSRWLAAGGHMGKARHALWPLEMFLDRAIVMAFAYQLGRDGKVTPYQARAGDVGEAALKEMLSTRNPVDEKHDRWTHRAVQGDFLPTRIRNKGAVRGRVGQTVRVAANLQRILVVLSFSGMRERTDFEPGGLVGFAKMFPHVMVRAGMALHDVKASVRVKRPTRTTQLDKGDGKHPASCCDAYPEIRSILVSDSNDDMRGPRFANMPLWSGLFSWFEVNPDKRLGTQRLHLVNSSKTKRRTVRPCGKRHLIVGKPHTEAIKVARQGEFDNIHLAPQLKLNATTVRLKQVKLASSPLPVRTPMMPQTRIVYEDITVDPARMKTDNIPMAPFCSHDCLHTHWRWSVDDGVKLRFAGVNWVNSSPWTRGWGRGSQAPFKRSGAPQVPPNQDIYMKMDGPSGYIYDAHAHKLNNREIKPLEWTVVFHHGAGYAQGILGWRKNVAEALVNFRSGAPIWLDANGKKLSANSSVPAFYWSLRYYFTKKLGGSWEVVDRLSISTGEVDEARKA